MSIPGFHFREIKVNLTKSQELSRWYVTKRLKTYVLSYGDIWIPNFLVRSKNGGFRRSTKYTKRKKKKEKGGGQRVTEKSVRERRGPLGGK